MVKLVIVLCALVGVVFGFPETSGPYPPAGWKPQGARLELPRNYGAPREQRTEPTSVIEITTLTNEYLPPTTAGSESDDDDALRVQGLPAVDAVSQFKSFQRRRSSKAKARPHATAARIQMAPAPAFGGQPLLLSSLFAPQFVAVNERLQERKFGQQQQQVPEFNNPKSDAQPFNSPAQAYGPPKTNNDEPEVRVTEPEVPQNEEPEQSQTENDDYEDDQDASGEPTVAVATAESNGDLVEVIQQGQVGQYYILLPDNSLQKVRFATKQTEDDRQFNGFSAQLR
jgi:hypothetical protein